MQTRKAASRRVAENQEMPIDPLAWKSQVSHVDGFEFKHLNNLCYNELDDIPQCGSPKQAGKGRYGDCKSISLLILLYVLQGIPLGLATSIPLLLQSHRISYSEQALFSLVFWPFSLKLLWAPLVDAIFSRRFGRRKSWLVPTQYMLGIFMLFLARHIDALLEAGNVVAITASFFIFELLAATQDIAVDGWALTMLSKENVGFASTCNSIGHTAGYFLGNVLFLALESASFCNQYLRTEPSDVGIVTLSDFLHFWGVVFMVTTTLVAIFKSEARTFEKGQVAVHGVLATYQQLLCVLKLRSVGFAAADSVTGLKLVESGVPKAQLAMLAVPLVPLQVILPLVISRYTAGPRPLHIVSAAIPFRLLMGLVFALLVWWTPYIKTDSGFPMHYYMALLVSYALHQISLYSMFVAQMAFNAKVSDPTIGGTYMTLLNTMCNLGSNWPGTLVLWLVDPLSSIACKGATRSTELSCSTAQQAQLCTEVGGRCETIVDGYYIESVLCALLGLLWWWFVSPRLLGLQYLGLSAWKTKPQL
uniref:acetyl-coenzyme A transporter 1 isoform X2 n=1 Tax=Myxine glutinosa TaxID=7769 RepID=UPI00358EEB68